MCVCGKEGKKGKVPSSSWTPLFWSRFSLPSIVKPQSGLACFSCMPNKPAISNNIGQRASEWTVLDAACFARNQFDWVQSRH